MIALVVLIWLLAIFVDTSQCLKLVIRSLSMPAKKFPANILLIDDDEDDCEEDEFNSYCSQRLKAAL